MPFHDLIQNPPGWRTLSDSTAFANPHAEVHLVKIATPTRPAGVDWTVIERKGGCVVVPVTPEGRLVLIRQERIPIRASIWEFPAGQIDAGGEHSPEIREECARRELREETGYELAPGGELRYMGLYFTSAGVTDEHSHLFVARPVVPSPGGPAHDEGESITECRAFTPEELRQMIATGEIRDANTLAAFARMTALEVL